MAVLSTDQVRDALLAGPSLYPQKVDLVRQGVLFVRLSAQDYEHASFLDDRILTPQSDGRWVSFHELAGWMQGAQPMRPLHFIFHAGHVGSTLLSRFLEAEVAALALREPLPLRTLAEAHDALDAPEAYLGRAQFNALLDWHLTLWSRGFDETRAVVLKATSSAGRLAPALLRARPGAQAIYINLAAEPYLATLLAGENSHLDLRGHGPERMRRLVQFGSPSPTPLHAMSIGELAAMTWAVEKLTQLRLTDEMCARVLSLDFDAFLAAPGEALRAACAHLGLAAPETFFVGAAESPILQQYSKAREHAYTPRLRAQVLAEARATHAGEISKGLAWLERFARASAPVAAALSA